MQKWGVSHWETYDQVVNWTSVRSLLDIGSKHEFPSRSIDFVPSFPQTELNIDVFMDLTLGMEAKEKIG